MTIVLTVLLVALLGWLYILCRLTNRVATVADTVVRLTIVGYVMLLVAPVAFGVLAWQALPYCDGWMGVNRARLAANPAALAAVAMGWAVVLAEVVRRRIAAYTRHAALAGRVTAQGSAVRSLRGALSWPSRIRTAVYSAAMRIPGNHIGMVHTFRFDVMFPDLPRTLDGLRIVHLSDFHHSPSLDPAYLTQVVSAANALDPDLVFLTGDFAHARSDTGVVAALLAPLHAPHGVFFVCGNHDIWHNEKPIVAALRARGFVHAAGECIPVRIGEVVIHIAGTERPWRHDTLGTALDRLPESAFCIALSHHPDNVRLLRRHRVSLVLSGHTHGGQIALPLLGPLLVPSARGSHHASGFVPYQRTLLYVNHGVSATMPLRLLCPPEIACLALRRTPA